MIAMPAKFRTPVSLAVLMLLGLPALALAQAPERPGGEANLILPDLSTATFQGSCGGTRNTATGTGTPAATLVADIHFSPAAALEADEKRRKLIFIAAYDELMSINEVLH